MDKDYCVQKLHDQRGKKRLFFDMDNVLVDFQSGLDKIDEETKKQYRAKGPDDKDRLDEIPGLFPDFGDASPCSHVRLLI